MSKSGRVRLNEVRRAYRLIHDCRDVGHDTHAWPAILVGGVARLVDAQVSTFGHIGIGPDGQPGRGDLLAELGWLSASDRRFWHEEYVKRQKFGQAPTFQRFIALPGTRITRSREQLASDDEWYRSAEFHEFVRVLGLDDFLAAGTRTGHPPALYTLVMVRSLGEQRFAQRERRLIRLFHHELAGHLGTTLVHDPGGRSSGCRRA